MPKATESKHPTLPSKIPPRLISIGLVFLVVVSTTIASLIIWYATFSRTHLPPNISVNGIAVGWMRYAEAAQLLESRLNPPPDHIVTLTTEGATLSSSSAQLGAHIAVTNTLLHFQASSREGRVRDRLQWLLTQLFTKTNANTPLQYNDQAVGDMIALLNQEVAYPPTPPSAQLGTRGNDQSLRIEPGAQGRAIDEQATKVNLALANTSSEKLVAAPIASVGAQLSADEVEVARARASAYVGKSVTVKSEWRSFPLSDDTLISLLILPDGYSDPAVRTIIEEWSTAINRAPQEPVFEFDPSSLRVTAFTPPRDGLELDSDATLKELHTIFSEIESQSGEETSWTISLPLQKTAPKQALSTTNTLGINERIGFGESTYKGSIPNRIYNVALSSDRISGYIIPPGSEFSFNRALGSVSSSTGFRSAYVIKNGMTTLGDGGGVCQTSTTLFRAVLDAGLEITRRLPHSYRVSYYEQDQKPGIDATVYSGETDFRFRNDTNHHLLLYAETDSQAQHMFFEIYGTSDGRTTEIVDHKTWNHRPAPAAQYFPDSSLAPGQLRQIDWAAPGVSASFTNIVRDASGSELHRDTYTSHYRPWAAKYLQGV